MRVLSVFHRIVLLCAMNLPGLAAGAGVPFRSLSFAQATEAAAREGKLVFIDFYTTWCEPCKRMDAETFSDAGVGKLVGEKAVALKLDAEKGGRDVAQQYKVYAYPTGLLLKPDGSEVDRIIGFRDAARFRAEFQAALDGKSSLTRAQEAVVASGAGEITPEAVKLRYELGQTLARRGEHAGALKEFLWCYDVGMVQVPSYRGVRTSFLVGELGRLANAYPPAKDALLQRCEAAERRMLANPEERQAAGEFAALCATLGDEARLLAAFDRLPRRDPRRAAFGLRAFRLLLPKQRYADALEVLPFASMLRLAERQPPATDAKAADINRQLAIRSMLDYIEVLAGAGAAEQAGTMIGKLKQVDASPETNALVEARLKRAREAAR